MAKQNVWSTALVEGQLCRHKCLVDYNILSLEIYWDSKIIYITKIIYVFHGQFYNNVIDWLPHQKYYHSHF